MVKKTGDSTNTTQGFGVEWMTWINEFLTRCQWDHCLIGGKERRGISCTCAICSGLRSWRVSISSRSTPDPAPGKIWNTKVMFEDSCVDVADSGRYSILSWSNLTSLNTSCDRPGGNNSSRYQSKGQNRRRGDTKARRRTKSEITKATAIVNILQRRTDSALFMRTIFCRQQAAAFSRSRSGQTILPLSCFKLSYLKTEDNNKQNLDEGGSPRNISIGHWGYVAALLLKGSWTAGV